METLKRYVGTKVVHARREIRTNSETNEVQAGYRVVYEYGYESWSPGDVFDRHYRRIDQMSFGLALEALKLGYAVARSGWNGKNMWLKLQNPDRHSKMTLPYIYMEYPLYHPAYPNGCRVPWLASQTDMLCDDWMIVDGISQHEDKGL